MNDRIAILGGDGLLAHSMRNILSKKFKVTSFSHFELDITDNWCYNLLDEFDIVVNTAAFKDVDRCEFDVEKAFEVNAEAPGKLAKYCKEGGKILVHISTDYVFGGEKDGKYKEDESPDPISVYGRSKLEGEKKIKAETDRYLIIRVAWLFGKGKLNFVDNLIRKLLNDEIIELIDDKWGNPTYTDTVSKAVVNLLDRNATGIYHVVNGGCTTRYDMGIFLKKFLGIESGKIIPISKDSVTAPAARPIYSCLSTKKYTNMTGERLESWRDTIRDYLNEIS